MADQQALELIQEDNHLAFNQLMERTGGEVDLSGAHLRAYDLRKYNLKRANLTGAYMRHADLRALDLSEANLEGASIREAKVSGTLMPRNIAAIELMLSLQHGTRLRVIQ
ncbi:MAG: pentapeptide repeat-containing protein [Candidatus Melainabacteria bacterium]